jgi:hypothetical protein
MATDALRRSVPRDVLGVLDVRKYLKAALVVSLPDLGQADTARAAIEQAHPQAFLEGPHVRRHHAGRYVEFACCGGKPADVDDFHKSRHAGHSIHGSPLPDFGADVYPRRNAIKALQLTVMKPCDQVAAHADTWETGLARS